MRTIFKDEVLAAYNGSKNPQYRLAQNSGGATEITLLNPLSQEGTKLTASVLNNLFDMDNMAGQSGYYKTTTFYSSSIAERMYARATGSIAAARDTSFLTGGNMQVTETIYDSGVVIRRTKYTVQFPTTGAIDEEVVDV